ncbi:pentraxin-4 [Chanos chanos]|uniref:Pentraxin-4 n=1 Tax=Chanos chanos TaxID=29144 RepID=A0A6J2WQ79_CHACN|nr:pentraxin-4 [Chanos chanos]
MCRRVTPGLFMIIVYLCVRQTSEQVPGQMEVRKPLYQRLRRLDEQFRRFQEVTLNHLQSIAENYNISYSIDTRFQLLTQQYESLSRDFQSFKASADQDLSSLKSWSKKFQKKTKRLDLRLANVERALRENNRLNHRHVQEHRTVIANLTQELREQRNLTGSMEAYKEEVQSGIGVLQDALTQQQEQMKQLSEQIQAMQRAGVFSSTGSPRSEDPLTSNRTPQGLVPAMLTKRVKPKVQPKVSKEDRVRNRLLPFTSTSQPRVFPEGRRLRDRKQGSAQTSTLPPEPPALPKEHSQIQSLLQLPLRHKIPQHHIPKKAASICNVHSALLFPSASAQNYVTFRKGFSAGIHEISICTWLKVDADYVGTLLSYATEDNDNKLVLYGRNSSIQGSMDFVIGDPAYRELSIGNILDGRWHHICVIWSSIEGRFWHYTDRRLTSTGSKFQKGYEIPSGGFMVLGQEQDTVGGGFDIAEAFVGRLAGFALWSRVLTPGEVSGVATGRGLPRGAVLTLDDVDQLHGSVQQVSCECLEHCI